MTNPHAWHVSAVLSGTGRRVYQDDRDFIFYVQRYRHPDEGRETGEVLRQSFTTEADAEMVAALLNADPARPRDARTCYL